eukprot:gene12117-13368_t
MGIWTPCGNRSTTKEECEPLNCCYVPDSFKEAKNISQNCAKKPESFTWKNGTCSKYQGLTCVPYLGNKTLEKDIFFDSRYGKNGTEAILVKFIELAKFSLKGGSAICSKLIPAAICHTMMPTCNANGRPSLSCKEDCLEIFRICGKYMDRFYGALELYIKQQTIDFSHLNVPTCTELKYSYEYDKSKGESCEFIGLFDHSKKPIVKSGIGIKTIAIIAACCGVALLLLVVLIVVYARRRSKRLEIEKKEAAKDLELFSNVTTVRDRIRQDSKPNPLLAALAQLSPDQKPPQCRLDRMEYVKDLGQGQFGKVFQGRYSLTEGERELSVAVKMLKEGSSMETKDSFIQEVTLMSVLNHDNILKLVAVSTEEEPFCMVFEYMVNGDLNQFLRKNDPENATETDKVPLPFGVLVDFAKQVACGMEYLSKKKFVHRDLATRNCLVGENMIVKIADFGMSRDIYDSEYYKVGGAAMLPIRWMPPEALLYGRFTIESDVYSYGILLWEIFTYALQPFYGYSNDEVVKFIKKGVVLPRPDLCSQVIYDKVLTKCWIHDAEKRLTFTEIIQRLDGNFDYAETRFPKKEKNKEKKEKNKEANQTYSVPPPATPVDGIDNHGRTVSRTKNGSTHDYQNFKPDAEDQGDEHLEVIDQLGAKKNPSFKDCDAIISEDLYDRPKSSQQQVHIGSSSDESSPISTLDRENNRNNSDADGCLYLVPKGTALNEDDGDEDEPSPEDQLYQNIHRKRYVSPGDVKRLSNKSNKSKFDSQTITNDRSHIL